MERTIRDLAAVRALRAELLGLAASPALGRKTLHLVHPQLSEQRIEEEWKSAVAALRPEIAAKLAVHLVYPDGRARVLGSPGPPVPVEMPVLRSKLHRLPPRDLSFAVEKLLAWAWSKREGPLTRKWLEQTAGCSYPTVAAVLKRLGSAVHRHPDRRVELSHVPRDEWARLFVHSGEARSVLRFVDRSDQPTTVGELLDRLRRVAPPGVAIGGSTGAQHYDREFDLVGTPRLDLSVHAPTREVDLGFVRQLDPALKPVYDAADPAVLVLHFVRHRVPLFEPAKSGEVPWADPIECLLDLQEAGLESQAVEFLDRLAARAAA